MKKIKEINKRYRNIDKPTNVLSFSLRKNEGELVFVQKRNKKRTKKFDRTFPELLGFLVIHGMLHLKGMEHGSIMEEAKILYKV